ncbi:hypothetical protein SPRG_00149 [Saprolegnia parasitica CBS 223.65]|uniref:Uncharacterized protein n=1 Tax=Saprolegnia parasitica (strain CBS 223.65) TaxID=695850 RepID=A0A067D1D6_SAPPC|nr:hypothetical protein SPRG_00149 [Saprolegnia parasitica CBS 223.65]KDO35300.1 hypothetical protein SPRG_00149 [Saprolegnia parasitica CBS 223.65]|eukprot:XP_012193647.1 hypothetical protein SPRG_00149 [Saprolegnia parasitica CBS 223.65]
MSSPPPAKIQKTAPVLTCETCGASTFTSRNQLFRHIKDCAVNMAYVADVGASVPAADTTHLYYYVTGGRLCGKTLGSVERYSFARKCWESVPSMLENRGSHGAVGVGTELFVLGGGGFRSNLATCEKLDVETATWSQIAPMTTYRHALAVVSIPETASIYCVGGWVNGSKCSPVLEKYDVRENAWATLAPMEVPRRLLALRFGGNADDHDHEDKQWYSNVVECFDPSTNTWSRKAPLPIAGPCSAVTIGKYIFVLLHGRSVVRYSPSENTYVTMAALPLPEWYCFDADVAGTTIYALGGISKGVWSREFYAYDTIANTWTQLPAMKKRRRRTAAALVTCPPPPSSSIAPAE